MPTQGWTERKSLAAQGIWSRLSQFYSHQTKSPFLFNVFDAGNSLNAPWLTRTRGVPSKHFFITATYPVYFQRRYLLSSINFSGTKPQTHIQPQFNYMTEPPRGWVSHSEVQDKSAHVEIFEKQGCWSVPKIRHFCVKKNKPKTNPPPKKMKWDCKNRKNI